MQPDHIGLNVHELDESIRFYCDWLGFELLQRWDSPRQAFVKLPGTNLESTQHLALGLMEAADYDFQRYTLAHVAFAVTREEFPRWVAKINEAKLNIVSGPKKQREGETILFRDPSGNILEICYPPLSL